jgi:arylsulfatase
VSSDEHWRAGLRFYLNCLRDVDRSIDLVLDALEASGQADRTIVILTADHGEMAGAHGLRQKGNFVYDENFHVPLVVRHPDVAGHRTSDAMASALDLAPTLLAFAGVEVRVSGPAESAAKPYMHARAAIVDDATAYLGSISLSPDSTAHNREFGLVFTDQFTVAKLRQVFGSDWQTLPSGTLAR